MSLDLETGGHDKHLVGGGGGYELERDVDGDLAEQVILDGPRSTLGQRCVVLRVARDGDGRPSFQLPGE